MSKIGHPAYNTNGEGGRPVRYTEEYVEFLADSLEEWLEDKENMFIERFCLQHNIPETIVSVELIKNKRFSKAYQKLKTKQKAMLFEGGLKRKFAHPMCALILSHNHNIYTKTEQKIVGNTDNPLACILNNIDGSSKDIVSDG